MEPLRDLSELARSTPGMMLLVLFGSRAAHAAHAASDWDFAYLAEARFDVAAFNGALQLTIGSSAIDLADLSRAGGVLRFQVASKGVLVFERRAGLFDAFKLEAATFWCDAQPVLQTSHRALLADFNRFRVKL